MSSPRWAHCLLLAACGGGGDGGPSGPPEPLPTSGFALSLSSPELSVARGASGTTQVSIARTNFSGAVALAVTGAPAGVTVTLDPASASSTSSTLSTSVGVAVAAGEYALTVTGTATGVPNRSAQLTLTVTAPGGASGNVTIDYSACLAGYRPIWFAYQDGTGPWTRVTATDDVYHFTMAAGKGGYAWVREQGGVPNLEVQLSATSELTGAPVIKCPVIPAKTVTGTVVGLGANDLAIMTLGNVTGASVSHSPGPIPFTIPAVPDGAHDLVAWRSDPVTPGASDRGFVRRDQNVPNGGSVGAVDFGGPDAFEPATATITVAGADGEQLSHGIAYSTGGVLCGPGGLSMNGGGLGSSASSFTVRGFPAARQRVTDRHLLLVTAIAPAHARSVWRSFHAMTARTITMPPPLPAPTIATLAGSYKRLQATFVRQPEHIITGGVGVGANFTYGTQSGHQYATVLATQAWIGATTATLAMPDLSSVTGWNDAWAPPASATGSWSIGAYGGDASLGLCSEGSQFFSATRHGTS